MFTEIDDDDEDDDEADDDNIIIVAKLFELWTRSWRSVRDSKKQFLIRSKD